MIVFCLLVLVCGAGDGTQGLEPCQASTLSLHYTPLALGDNRQKCIRVCTIFYRNVYKKVEQHPAQPRYIPVALWYAMSSAALHEAILFSKVVPSGWCQGLLFSGESFLQPLQQQQGSGIGNYPHWTNMGNAQV